VLLIEQGIAEQAEHAALQQAVGEQAAAAMAQRNYIKIKFWYGAFQVNHAVVSSASPAS
jgi:hypothetical protein